MLALVTLAQGHQARHLELGKTKLFAAEIGQGEVGNFEVETVLGFISRGKRDL